MPKMKTSGQRGYTIIEVVLVLAISAALGLIAVFSIGTRQNAVSFSQEMREIEQRIQTTFSNASDGQFVNLKDKTCEYDGSGNMNISDTAGTNLGESSNCMYLGKVIAFGRGTSDEDRTHLTVYTIVGERPDLAIESADASRTNAVNARVLTDINEEYEMKWGIRVLAPVTVPAGVTYTNVVGAVNALGDGNQRIMPFALNDYFPVAADQVVELDNASSYDVGPHFGQNFTPHIICFERADGEQIAQITVGSTGQKLTTELEFDTCEAIP